MSPFPFLCVTPRWHDASQDQVSRCVDDCRTGLAEVFLKLPFAAAAGLARDNEVVARHKRNQLTARAGLVSGIGWKPTPRGRHESGMRQSPGRLEGISRNRRLLANSIPRCSVGFAVFYFIADFVLEF
jgi:hypothetical protein